MALLPGVNVTNVISNAPGVLVRGVGTLPTKVRFSGYVRVGASIFSHGCSGGGCPHDIVVLHSMFVV